MIHDPKVGDVVTHHGEAWPVTTVHCDAAGTPIAVDCGPYQSIPLAHVDLLVPEPGWEAHRDAQAPAAAPAPPAKAAKAKVAKVAPVSRRSPKGGKRGK